MRLLFTFAGGMGHFLPLQPLARAAQTAGHEVVVGAQPRLVERVAALGFRALDTGGGSLVETTERSPLRAVSLEEEKQRLRVGFGGARSRERATTIRSLCEDLRPTVLICDEMDFGALIAAEALGIPAATVVCIGSGSWIWSEVVGEPLNELRSEHGLPPDPSLARLLGAVTFTPFPATFRDPANPLPASAQPLRTGSAERGVDPADAAWLSSRSARPLVYFTLGTIFNLESGDLFERVLAGLSELDADVVVTVGQELDPTALGPQPPSVRVRRYVPQAVLLPECALAISHGGSGSVLGALAHGVPMVVLPIAADQPLNAARCAELGIGRVVDPIAVSAADIAATATAVLTDDAYRRNVEPFAAEIATFPTAEESLRLVEALA